ncbi:MAG: DUF2752 domain-containing protein [Bacteroidetes Order II. Incertae sedis bacterium]|jgi:hypothetical protein|nr:DUF2752 domain-containing protein [Bacteroidetes Order II. bacterium]MBT4051884.1 DUF2752 domain-containing protein [Bacteroidetes Order II. bacterium]MBT4601732.1 DUF2752 domain-containing protein [Bacteroidetes Order II. bacterium]MBT5249431.1 DUF2752 domain-containing protein [Bacteroidetes Order II. bacterium]MBT6201472.1 DUF2752 domain-containing protein [Bacteroidetes Order II. bacterium]
MNAITSIPGVGSFLRAFSAPSGRMRYWMEAGMWSVGLAAMCIADPTAESWIELCLFKAIGLGECPGCGLGHALGFLVRGEWHLAMDSHLLSPFVAIVLSHRISSLTIKGFSN